MSGDTLGDAPHILDAERNGQPEAPPFAGCEIVVTLLVCVRVDAGCGVEDEDEAGALVEARIEKEIAEASGPLANAEIVGWRAEELE